MILVIVWSHFINCLVYGLPKLSEVAGQVREEGAEGQNSEQSLHVFVLDLKDGEGDGPHARPHQLLLAVVEVDRCLVKRERLYAVIEEKVDRLVVELEHEGLQEVDEIVDHFVILQVPRDEVVLNKVSHKGVAEQVE